MPSDRQLRKPFPELDDDFWAQVNKDGPIPENRPDLGNCWLWTGKVYTNGYGRWNTQGFDYGVHRLSYERHWGKLADGLVPDHLCLNKLCVRPSHLDACTQEENTRRWAEQNVTACPQGHEYTEWNTLVSGGWRSCRTCRDQRQIGSRPADWRRTNGRQVNTSTKIGWLIAHSGYTQYEICAFLGIGVTAMSNYVNGRKAISNTHLLAMQEFFGLEPEDLIGLSYAPVDEDTSDDWRSRRAYP